MQFKNIFTVLAVSLSMVMAEEESTTTSTSTMTRTLTITQCNPTNTECAGYSSSVVTSSSASYPLSNSTVSVGPTAGFSNSSIIISPTKSTVTHTSVVNPTQPPATTVPTGGAGGLAIQSGLLLAVLGAGMAIVA